MTHAVFRLRAERLERSTRPFVARGSGSRRCSRCRLATTECACALRPTVPTRAGVCLLMHRFEAIKPSNTGWLVADVVEDTTAFAWSRTEPDPRLLALLADPHRRPYVVFPGDAVPPERVVTRVAPDAGRRPLFVLFDATWAEARKMFHRSPYLDAFPVLSLACDRPSRYRLRRMRHGANLCTAEGAARCLDLAGEPAAARALDGWLDVFVERSMRLRGQA